jgi:hypothetical protein
MVARGIFVVVLLLTLSACVDRLPDQDLRIFSTTPIAKLSADILWKEYQADRSKADAVYRGRAVVVTGGVTQVGSDAPTDRFILFGQPEQPFGVRANLLDDQAKQILESAAVGQRLTLKCFCEGLSEHVVLKSCVQP